MRNLRLVPTTSSSSKNSTKPEQPHLSGAYIRSLVKQLSSSSRARSRDSTMGTKPHSQPHEEEEQQALKTTTPQQQQPHKKQVRRRLHTSRPYQERLLNMAEARREIISALKIHRASMRQAKEQQQQQQQQQLLQEVQAVQLQEQGQTSRIACAPSPMNYASFSGYLYNSPFAQFTATSSSSYYSSPLPYQTPMVAAFDQLLPLPAQPLGLNLSFQGFNGVDAAGNNAKNSTGPLDPPLLLQPSPASSYSVYSSPPVMMASNDMSGAIAAENTSQLAPDALLHRVLDDQEMAAIYTIGEQHDIEWSDTVNLVTSAWWSRLLQSIEGGEGTSVGDMP